jgi:hypothetical protein
MKAKGFALDGDFQIVYSTFTVKETPILAGA